MQYCSEFCSVLRYRFNVYFWKANLKVRLIRSSRFGVFRFVRTLDLSHTTLILKKKYLLPHIIDKEPIELHLHAGSKLGDNLEEPILQQPDTSCLFDRDLTPYYKVFTGGKWHSHYDLIRKSVEPEVK